MQPLIGHKPNETDGPQTTPSSSEAAEANRISQQYGFVPLINADFTQPGLSLTNTNSIGLFEGNDFLKVETLTDPANRALHQRGSYEPPGVRDFAHYNKRLDKVLQVFNDADGQYLVQRCSIDGPQNSGDMCTSWLDSYGITFRGPNNSDKGPDLSKPNVTFGKNTFFEIYVNFSAMQTPGFRHSFWLMPASENVPDRGPLVRQDDAPFPSGSVAYDGRSSARNGVEIDIYEHEISPGHETEMLMKVIAGDKDTGETGSGNTINRYPNNFQPKTHVKDTNINSGWHKIGFLWSETELIWFIDGRPVVRDDKLMPNDARMFLLLTRELSTVIFQQDPTTRENRAKAINDLVKIRYIRAWSVVPQGDGSSEGGSFGAPTGVVAVKFRSNQAKVNWNSVPGAEKYNVYRNGNYEATVSGTEFKEYLNSGQTYRYSIVAIDQNSPSDQMTFSPQSDEVTVFI